MRTTFGRERLSKLTFYPHKPRDRSRFRILLGWYSYIATQLNLSRPFSVRHGQSLANVDPLLYTRISDHAVPLSQRGVEQAMEIGTLIRDFYKVLFASLTVILTLQNSTERALSKRIAIRELQTIMGEPVQESKGDCFSHVRDRRYG